ncbi:MAG: ABC transporter permease [Candidatus Omnitrophica bacterium]|nr:ABC transporter permease [Candidatus Omnitrophota bacterium]MBU4334375.1 ABC transporter permease [Candidatus Omnitrophota bacterium]
MGYENWISYRYLIASKGRFLTFLNVISIAGVAIGVMALIIVIGVMTGFGNNLREKIIGTTPHIMIEKETTIENYSAIQKNISNIAEVENSAPYVQGNIFLESSGQAIGLVVRGIDAIKEDKVTKISQYLIKGDLKELKGDNVIIGSELARYFGYSPGDEITLISPSSGLSGQGWRYKFKISGIFTTGMADYDMNVIAIDIIKAQEIFGLPEGFSTGIGVKLQNPNQSEEVKEKIYNLIGYGYIVKTWIDSNRNLFDALFLEKWGLFIILTLMVIVASFNIISTLVVTVTSKIHDIGILKSIGVTKKSIRRIFIKQGLFIGSLGTFWGVLLGVSISYILKNYVKVPKEIYSIDHVPVELQMFDMFVIVAAALIISYLATIYPAAKAASLEPVEALRYE